MADKSKLKLRRALSNDLPAEKEGQIVAITDKGILAVDTDAGRLELYTDRPNQVKIGDTVKPIADKLLELGSLAGKNKIAPEDVDSISAENVVINDTEVLEDVVNNKVDKVDDHSLVADDEITKLATVSEGANKVEASTTNGNIKIDEVETVVYDDSNLQQRVDQLEKVDNFLSTWDGTTGLPGSDPKVLPFIYQKGDYFRVAKLESPLEETLIPSGTQYDGNPSTTKLGIGVALKVGDIFFYDGANWVIQEVKYSDAVYDVITEWDRKTLVKDGVACLGKFAREGAKVTSEDMDETVNPVRADQLVINGWDDLAETVNAKADQTALEAEAAIREATDNTKIDLLGNESYSKQPYHFPFHLSQVPGADTLTLNAHTITLDNKKTITVYPFVLDKATTTNAGLMSATDKAKLDSGASQSGLDDEISRAEDAEQDLDDKIDAESRDRKAEDDKKIDLLGNEAVSGQPYHFPYHLAQTPSADKVTLKAYTITLDNNKTLKQYEFELDSASTANAGLMSADDKTKLDGTASQTDLDTEVARAKDAEGDLQDAIDSKVDKNGTDRLMTTEEGFKLASIAEGAVKVEVSATGTATEEVQYITITAKDGKVVEKKLAGGGSGGSYTAGDGIDITSNTISTKLGNGLKIDNSKITLNPLDNSIAVNGMGVYVPTVSTSLDVTDNGLAVKIADDSIEAYNSGTGTKGIRVNTNKIQPKLTAGTNITISADNVISAAGGDLSAYRKAAEQDVIDNAAKARLDTIEGKEAGWDAKQDAIEDLSTIRTGAGLGATAVQPGAISDMATKTWVGDQGFLTSHQSLAAYRTASEQDTIDNKKVDKVTGKGLSTNDFTDEYKAMIPVTNTTGYAVASGTATTGCSVQDWDGEGKYVYCFDVNVTDMTVGTRVFNMITKLNSASDAVAPVFDSLAGKLRFYTTESALSADFKIYNFDISVQA